MFENLINIFKKNKRGEEKTNKDTAKERLHLVLMQDRANVSADFLGMMKQEIIEVIKKYIDVEEEQIDVKLTNKMNSDGTTGAPALYANIPIKSIKNESRKFINTEYKKESNETPSKTETKVETVAEKTEKVEENKAEEPKKEEAKKVENKKVETKKAETKKTETKKADAKKEAKADKKEDKSKEKETVKEEKAQVEPKAIFFSNVTDKK